VGVILHSSARPYMAFDDLSATRSILMINRVHV